MILDQKAIKEIKIPSDFNDPNFRIRALPRVEKHNELIVD
jgi:hypothetical protein